MAASGNYIPASTVAARTAMQLFAASVDNDQTEVHAAVLWHDALFVYEPSCSVAERQNRSIPHTHLLLLLMSPPHWGEVLVRFTLQVRK
jgi:hypothetical protein